MNIVVKSLKQKFYWYPCKLIFNTFLSNSNSLEESIQDFDKLEICSQFMNLLVARDEQALVNIFDILFKEKEILRIFFLGYGLGSDCISKDSLPFYNFSEFSTKLSFRVPHNNPYLPLDDQWFINPVLYSKKANKEEEDKKETDVKAKTNMESSLSCLFTEIFKFLISLYVTKEKANPVMIKIFKEMSISKLLAMALSYISYAYIQEKTALITNDIVEASLQIYFKFKKDKAIENLNEEDKKALKDAGEISAQFLNEFGFIEEGSKFITFSVFDLIENKIIDKDLVKVSLFFVLCI